MKILVVSCGTRYSGACLISDETVISCKMENETALTLPKNEVDQILGETGVSAGAVDYLVFLGKPLGYLERILDTHMRTFPWSLIKFYSECRDFFINKLSIKAIAKKDLNFNKDILYVEISDVLAWRAANDYPNEDVRILTVLSNSLSNRVGGVYLKKSGNVFLEREFHLDNFLESSVKDEELLKNNDIRRFKALVNDYFLENSVIISDIEISQQLCKDLMSKHKNLRVNILKKEELLENAGLYALDWLDKR